MKERKNLIKKPMHRRDKENIIINQTLKNNMMEINVKIYFNTIQMKRRLRKDQNNMLNIQTNSEKLHECKSM